MKASPTVTSPKSKCAAPALLTDLLTRAREQFARLKDSDKENALRGVFLGGLFFQIKDAAGHGNFERLATEKMPDIPKRTRAELMRLWLVFAKQAKLGEAKAVELPDAQLALAGKAADAKVVKAALKFVGELSLHALMTEHGVREAKKLGGARKAGDDGEGEQLDAEQLYLFKRDEIGGVLQQAKQLLVDDNALQHLAGHPEEIAGVVAGLRELADKVEAAARPLIKPAAQE